jgi:hypothetical protein
MLYYYQQQLQTPIATLFIEESTFNLSSASELRSRYQQYRGSRFLGDIRSTDTSLQFSSVPIEQECYYSYRQLQTPIATTKYCAGGGQYDCTDSTAQISRYSVASMLKLPKHKVEVTGEMSEPPPSINGFGRSYSV